MSPQQKYAAFNLAVAAVSTVVYFVLLPFLGPWRATGAFGLLGLCGLSAVLLYRRQDHGQVITDEREQQIWQHATLVAKVVIWVGLIAAFNMALLTVGADGLVSMRWLALGIWWMLSIFLLVQSAVFLFLEAR